MTDDETKPGLQTAWGTNVLSKQPRRVPRAAAPPPSRPEQKYAEP